MKKIILSIGTLALLTSNINAVSFADIQKTVEKPAKPTKGFTLGSLGTFEFKKDHDNVWIMHGPAMNPSVENEGFMNNPAVIEGKHSLIVVDPGGNYNVGKKILAQIERISDKPIVATINTHKHGDHWFANKAILEKYPNLLMYAHPNMIEAVKNGEADKWFSILQRLSKNLDGTNNEFPYPNRELKGGKLITIDGEKFLIRHPKRAHTDTDIVITHLNSDTMFLGDNLMKSRLGGFDESSSLMGNITLLENIEKEKEHKLYVPGHGPSGKMHETIDPFLNYVKIVVEEAGKAYEEDVETYEIKDRVVKRLKEYQSWDAFDDQMGKHLMKAYTEWEESDM
jgi:glyoxylase-like metal-dependent hydrolase (beta-lactamase superfamily II)